MDTLADMDFETYSEAGFTWTGEKWIRTGTKGGIFAVGAWCYTEHPTCEVLCLYYNLKDGLGQRAWIPGCPPPEDLFAHIAAGGLIEAHNSFFEFAVWHNVCSSRMGWPELPLGQLRCSASKARHWSLQGALAKISAVLGCAPKDADGIRVMRKLSVPRKPTKGLAALRHTPESDPLDFIKLYKYCGQDIIVESEVSSRIPDLSGYELEVWKLDQRINARGVYCDRALVDASLDIVRQAAIKYNAELRAITGGVVAEATELPKIKAYCASRGFPFASLDKANLALALERTDLPPDVMRILEIRAVLGSSSVAKFSAMAARMSRDSRIRDVFTYCGAGRTGRWAGGGIQPQNMPGGFPPEKAEQAIALVMTRDLAQVEQVYPNPINALVGVLRATLCAAPGHDLICSDYSAIEARVLAELSGELWRQEVFRSHGKIYEMSAAKITGIPFQEFLDHKVQTGEHHPMRAKIGKLAELASGFQGALGAWKAFGAGEFMSDAEIERNVRAWRDASPAIVAFWRGLEAAAINAVRYPGQCFAYRGITYGLKGDVLYARLPSGRLCAYHTPRLRPDVTPWGKEVLKLSYWGVPTPPRPQIWSEIDTYGGKLCENAVQAVARDLLAHAMLKLDAAGYPIVLHIHDEIVAEVPKGTGSIEEFETLMAEVPYWAKGWPIISAGGWRGKRFRKG